jgi:hypothetical protein
VSGRSRAESQVGVRLMGVWRVSYSNIQEFFSHDALWTLLLGLMAMERVASASVPDVTQTDPTTTMPVALARAAGRGRRQHPGA